LRAVRTDVIVYPYVASILKLYFSPPVVKNILILPTTVFTVPLLRRCGGLASASMDVIFASLVLATVLGIGIYAVTLFSKIYWSEARYLVCLSKAVRYSDLFLRTRDGVAGTRSGVLVYGLVDCSRLPAAYSFARSKGFTGRVCCGDLCIGPEGEYAVVLRRTAYWPAAGIVPFTVQVCPLAQP